MAVIRVPEEAKPLLPLCRKHECGPAEHSGPACFETYADLIVFAASYGFAEMNGRVPNRKSKFLEQPNPIDFSIFKTEKRFPQILLIALATSKDKSVVRDEESICRLIEDYAALGCSRTAHAITNNHIAQSHIAISNILANWGSDTSVITI